jgi:hypothetical protein
LTFIDFSDLSACVPDLVPSFIFDSDPGSFLTLVSGASLVTFELFVSGGFGGAAVAVPIVRAIPETTPKMAFVVLRMDYPPVVLFLLDLVSPAS